MTITEKRVDGTLVATLDGRFDAVAAPDFDRWFAEAAPGAGARVIVNLGPLAYISSAGLRSLLAATKRLNAAGGRLDLCGMKGVVEEVLAVAGFLSIFKTFATEQDALAPAHS